MILLHFSAAAPDESSSAFAARPFAPKPLDHLDRPEPAAVTVPFPLQKTMQK